MPSFNQALWHCFSGKKVYEEEIFHSWATKYYKPIVLKINKLLDP